MELNIEELVNQIIPPNDKEHREFFSNYDIIDQLDQSTRESVESALIKKLLAGSYDVLIVETLAYLKSIKALPLLYNLLERRPYPIYKLVVASFIYEIEEDPNLIDIAITECDGMTDKFDLISAFYYLSKFNNIKTNAIIGSYTNDEEYLISYNAKRFWINNEKTKNSTTPH